MNTVQSAPGLYGKVPSHGDFLSRRLPRQFVEPWDHWLQAGLRASREQLGEAWLDTFLYSPIWQFALAPGLCGNDAWAGVMMPSVDRVGRYFPLTLLAKVNGWPLTALFEPECAWFSALGELALGSLDYDFDLERFDARLMGLGVEKFLTASPKRYGGVSVESKQDRQAFHYQLASEQDTPRVFQEIGARFGQRFLARSSYWRTVEVGGAAALLVCDGMPPIDAYSGFLNGVWPTRQWQLSYLQPETLPYSEAETVLEFSGTERGAEDGVKAPEKPRHWAYIGSGWSVDSAGLSVVGMRRKLNEDAILDLRSAGLWVVADGMGGHSAGDVASQMLVSELATITRFNDIERFRKQVEASLQFVNRELLNLAESRGSGQIIGSTVVVLLIADGSFRCLWAGDSRLYRYRQGVLEKLTEDHSLTSFVPDQQSGAAENYGVPVHENVITRAVGADDLLEIDGIEGRLEDRDLFILCSDGLIKELSDTEIAEMCRASIPEDLAPQLVHAAENRGGRDNISVVVVEVALDQ